MHDPKTGKLRAQGSTLSLGGLLHSLGLDPPCALHNAGNDAFLCLLALQKMLDPDNTLMPDIDLRRLRKPKHAGMGVGVPVAPVQLLGLTIVGDGGRPRSAYLTPEGRGHADGSPDEMGLVRRVSAYGTLVQPGGSKEDKENERLVNKVGSVQGIRSTK